MKKILIVLAVIAIIWYSCTPHVSRVKNVGNSGWQIVAIGDSLTYGKGAKPEESYPSLLEKALDRSVLNLGHNGETAVQGAQRIKQALYSDPYMVLIEFGGNDYIQSTRFEDTIAAVEQMVNAVQEAGAVAVIVDTGGSYVMGSYTKYYKKIAQEKGAVYVSGILNGIMGKKELMSDKVHPNAKGYAIIAKKIEKEILPYLHKK